jgi:YVTN family beta-propeller protein
VFVSGADWFLPSTLDRRTLLKGASSAALGLIASACASSSQASPRSAGSPAGSGGKASETGSAPAQSATVADGAEDRQTVYVFNVGSKDVTLIDVANRQVRETRPLGASVRWLSNEQTYWDGARIWTYDFPNDQVQAIAIEPRQVAVTKTIGGLGKGPGHSLVVLPDKKKAAVNVAGDNLIAFLDLEHGSLDSTLQTGAFP